MSDRNNQDQPPEVTGEWVKFYSHPLGGEQQIAPTIGAWADYFDTGIWTLKDGQLVAPDDLTIRQLKDHLTATGGAVYLRADRKLVWFSPLRVRGFLGKILVRLMRP